MCEDAPLIFCSQVFSHQCIMWAISRVWTQSLLLLPLCHEWEQLHRVHRQLGSCFCSICLRKFHNWIKFDLKKHIYTYILIISATHYVNCYSLTTHHLITTLSVLLSVQMRIHAPLSMRHQHQPIWWLVARDHMSSLCAGDRESASGDAVLESQWGCSSVIQQQNSSQHGDDLRYCSHPPHSSHTHCSFVEWLHTTITRAIL